MGYFERDTIDGETVEGNQGEKTKKAKKPASKGEIRHHKTKERSEVVKKTERQGNGSWIMGHRRDELRIHHNPYQL